MENTLMKSKSYGWLKRKVKNNTNKIYMGQKVAPVYKVWQTDAGWFARQVDTLTR